MRRVRISRAGLAWHAAALRRRTKDGVSRVTARLPTSGVALTFDDGPRPGSTDHLLDVLGELEVPATFFCVGKNAHAHPELVERMLAEGHTVGSHSYSHPHPRDASLAVLAREYRRGRDAVAQLGGSAQLFRPPHGHLSATAAVVIRTLGLRPWLWSVDPEDWRPGMTTQQIRDVAGRAGPGDVVLLHDWIEQPWAPAALDRSATITAVRHIVADARARGLTFERIDSSRSGTVGTGPAQS